MHQFYITFVKKSKRVFLNFGFPNICYVLEWLKMCTHVYHDQNGGLLPGRPVQLNILTYLESIQPCSNNCADNIDTQPLPWMSEIDRRAYIHTKIQNSGTLFNRDSS